MWGGIQWPQSKIRKSTNLINKTIILANKLIRKTGQSKILKSMENFSKIVTLSTFQSFHSAVSVLLMDKKFLVDFYKNHLSNFEQNSIIKKVYRKSII